MHTVSFPGLGIGPFEIDSVAFTLPFFGGLDIMWYAVLITCGVALAALYATYRGKKSEGVDPDHYYWILIWLMSAGVVGARLYYVIFNPSQFDSFFDVINIRSGGLAIYGGLIGGIAAVCIYCRVKQLNILQILDTIAPGVMVAQAIGRWGNFMNAEAHGGIVPESSPLYFLRMGLLPNEDSFFETFYYHPTFLYESLWNLLGFLLIHFLLYQRKKHHGEVFFLYITWYGLGRMFIEGLRTDSLYLGSTNIRVSQLLAFLCLLAGSAVLVYMRAVKPGRDLAKNAPYTPVFSNSKSEELLSEEPSDEKTAKESDIEEEEPNGRTD